MAARRTSGLLISGLALLVGICVGRVLPRSSEPATAPESAAPKRPISALGSGASDLPSAKAKAKPTNGTIAALAPSLAKLRADLEDSGAEFDSTLWHAALATADAETVKALTADLFQHEDPRTWGAANIAFSFLARLQPAAAWDLASEVSNKPRRNHLLRTAMVRLAIDDPTEAKRIFEAINDRTLKGQLRGALISALARADPEAALAYAATMPKPQQHGHGYGSMWSSSYIGIDPFFTPHFSPSNHGGHGSAAADVFATWASQDPAAAAARAMTLEGSERTTSLLRVAAAWGQKDAAAAAAWAKDLPVNERNQALGSIVSQLASKDARAAVALLEEFPASMRNNYAHGIVANFANQDLEGAIEWVDSQPRTATRNQWAAQLIPHIAKTDPERAASYFEQQVGTNNQSHSVLQNLISTWVQTDGEAAMRWLQNQPGINMRNHVAASALGQWATTDPAAAASVAEGLLISDSNSSTNANLLRGIAKQWAQQDIGAAMTWAEGLAEESDRRYAMNSAFSSWAYQDVEAASDYFANLPEDSEMRHSALGNVAAGFAQLTDTTRLDAWLEELSPSDQQTALERVASNYATPSETALAYFDRLVEVNGDSVSGLGGAAGSIASRMAQTDFDSALEWITDLPDAEVRNEVASSLANQMSHQDPMAASEAIRLMEAGRTRDSSVRNLVNAIQQIDPQAAFEWSLDISDESIRERSAKQTVQNWARLEGDATRSAIEQANISEDLRTSLLESLPK